MQQVRPTPEQVWVGHLDEPVGGAVAVKMECGRIADHLGSAGRLVAPLGETKIDTGRLEVGPDGVAVLVGRDGPEKRRWCTESGAGDGGVHWAAPGHGVGDEIDERLTGRDDHVDSPSGSVMINGRSGLRRARPRARCCRW